MRTPTVLLVALCVSLGAIRWLTGGGQGMPEAPPVELVSSAVESPRGESASAALSDSSASGCQAGCSTANHPVRDLTEPEYRAHLAQWVSAQGEESTAALETLLFHGRQARRFVSDLGLVDLPVERASFLLRELSRTHARVWLRLVDDHGVIRASVDGARFPIGEKEHVPVTSSVRLQPPEISGTVHRTGLHHLWTRI